MRELLRGGTALTVANGDRVHYTQFVHIYIQMSSVKFYLTLRIAPMHPDLILGAPFLVRFNPLIDWQARNFRIIRTDGPHRIPIVSKHSSYDLQAVSFPHNPATSASSKGIPFPEWDEPKDEDVKAVAKLYERAGYNHLEPKIPSSNPSVVPNSPRKKKKKKGTRPEIVAIPKPVADRAPDMEELLNFDLEALLSETPSENPDTKRSMSRSGVVCHPENATNDELMPQMHLHHTTPSPQPTRQKISQRFHWRLRSTWNNQVS